MQIRAGAHNIWWERQERAVLWRRAWLCGLGSVPLAPTALTPGIPTAQSWQDTAESSLLSLLREAATICTTKTTTARNG